MPKFLHHWLTARNNKDYSLTKATGIAGELAMIYKFIITPIPDYLGFGIGTACLMAALAGKYFVEGLTNKNEIKIDVPQ